MATFKIYFRHNYLISGDLHQFLRIKYKTGIRPSVAESIRAVFAAFLWHEGLVHDSMTCASYLKFHPQLCKDLGTVVRRRNR